MDSIVACWANSMLGNPVNSPFIEIGGGGFVAEFTKSANVAIAGAWGDFTLDGQPLTAPAVTPVKAGEVLKIGRLSSGLFTYFAVEGGFDMTPYLGSVATCQRDALGGADGSGNALAAGDALSHEDQPIKATD